MQVTLTFDGTTGRLKSWADASSGLNVAVAHDLLYYRGSQGNKEDGQGAWRRVTGDGGRVWVCGCVVATVPLSTLFRG